MKLPLELTILFLFYPLLLLFGQSLYLFSLLIGQDKLWLYDGPNGIGTRFGLKGNFLNVYFVKKGWLWTTVAISILFSCIVLYFKFFVTNNQKLILKTQKQIKTKKDDNENGNLISNPNKDSSKALFWIFIRYILITTWFIFYTQWFFGMPIMDRIFLVSGGSCQINVDKDISPLLSPILVPNIGLPNNLSPENNQDKPDSLPPLMPMLSDPNIDSIDENELTMKKLNEILDDKTFISKKGREIIKILLENQKKLPKRNRKVITPSSSSSSSSPVSPSPSLSLYIASSSICRKIRGSWVNGHDPSGHLFLMTQMSLYIWFELIPLINNILLNKPTIKALAKSTNSYRNITRYMKYALGSIFALQMIWVWMMLMTAVYFHSFTEKVVGMIFGYIGVTLVYVIGGDYVGYPYL